MRVKSERSQRPNWEGWRVNWEQSFQELLPPSPYQSVKSIHSHPSETVAILRHLANKTKNMLCNICIINVVTIILLIASYLLSINNLGQSGIWFQTINTVEFYYSGIRELSKIRPISYYYRMSFILCKSTATSYTGVININNSELIWILLTIYKHAIYTNRSWAKLLHLGKNKIVGDVKIVWLVWVRVTTVLNRFSS